MAFNSRLFRMYITELVNYLYKDVNAKAKGVIEERITGKIQYIISTYDLFDYEMGELTINQLSSNFYSEAITPPFISSYNTNVDKTLPSLKSVEHTISSELHKEIVSYVIGEYYCLDPILELNL